MNKIAILLLACLALSAQATAQAIAQATPQTTAQANMPHMHLVQHVAPAPVTRPVSCSPITATDERLVSSVYRYESKSQNTNDNFSYTYTYAPNGLPLSVVGTNGSKKEYEFTLNAQGFWTKRVVYNVTNEKRTPTEQTVRTYDELNRLTSESEYKPNSDGSGFVLSSKSTFAYDNGAEGYRSSYSQYDVTGSEISISQTLWLKAKGCYVANRWEYPNNRTEIKVDNGQNTCTFFSYSSPEATAIDYYTTTTYSLLFDGHYVETACIKTQYAGEGNVSKSGTMTDVQLDLSTSDVTVKPYSVVYVGETAERTPKAWRVCSLNEYLQKPVTEANGNRHSACYDAETNLPTQTYTCSWVGHGIAKERRGAADGSTTTTYRRYDADGKSEGEVCFCSDGSFTVADKNRRESLQDFKDSAVYIGLYDAAGCLQNQLKCKGSVSDAFFNSFVPTFVMKSGDSWVAAANLSFTYSNGNGACLDITTDAFGRASVCRSRLVLEGESSASYISRCEYSYLENGNVREVEYRYKDPHDETTEYAAHYAEKEKTGNGLTVVFYEDETFTAMTQKTVYDIAAHSITHSRWRDAGWVVYNIEALTEAHFDGDIYVYTACEKDRNGNIVPTGRCEKMLFGTECWVREYAWDAATSQFVGLTGRSLHSASPREFSYIEPVPFEDSYDGFCSLSVSPTVVCGSGDSTMNISFEWDSDSNSWLMSKEGYTVSDDGLTCRYFYEEDGAQQEVEYVRRADGRLVSYSGSITFPFLETVNKQTYTYDSEGRVTMHVKTNKRTNFDSTITYCYNYDKVEVSAVDDISADMVARLKVNARTFSLSGAGLSLYDPSGRLVMHGHGSVTAPSSGLYLLKSEGKTVKVVVK